MRYTPTYFKAPELVPKDVYDKHKEKSLLLMDDRILWTLDRLRETLKKRITVNNWKAGGPFSQRGFRTDPRVGTIFSAHRLGRAADFDVEGFTASNFREMLREGSFAKELSHVTRIEEDVNWIHIDVAGLPRLPGQEIEFFKP